LFFAERIKVSLIIIFLLIIYAGAYSQDTTGPFLRKGNMGGYMITRLTRSDTTFNAGYSMYAAAWPLVKAYPGRSFQSGGVFHVEYTLLFIFRSNINSLIVGRTRQACS
jgi:hypothetical protein